MGRFCDTGRDGKRHEPLDELDADVKGWLLRQIVAVVIVVALLIVMAVLAVAKQEQVKPAAPVASRTLEAKKCDPVNVRWWITRPDRTRRGEGEQLVTRSKICRP